MYCVAVIYCYSLRVACCWSVGAIAMGMMYLATNPRILLPCWVSAVFMTAAFMIRVCSWDGNQSQSRISVWQLAADGAVWSRPICCVLSISQQSRVFLVSAVDVRLVCYSRWTWATSSILK